MTTKTITALTEASTPAAGDFTIITVDGVARKATLANLILALSIASTSSKGLMSAADKIALDSLVASYSTMMQPQVVVLPSASTITFPAISGPHTVVVLSGTTEVTAINGLVENREYFISYPTGSGLTVLGVTMAAGDINHFIYK